MKTSRDSALTPPFRDWIEPSVPLPQHVMLVPRSISIALDALLLVLFGGFFGPFAALMIRAIQLDRAKGEENGDRAWIWMAIIAALCASVVLFFLHRLVVTCRAALERSRGTLRQGVFVGREGILIRLVPNRSLAIPADRFVSARRYPPVESRDPRAARIDIETKDGPFTFMESRCEGGASAIESAVKVSLPNHRAPPVRERADRKRRRDPQARGSLIKLARQIAVAIVIAVVAVLGVTQASEGSPARAASEWVLVAALAWFGVAFALLVPRAWRLTHRYRCPDCSGPTNRVAVVLPKVHHYCAKCNIEWDTGLEESDGTD